MTETELVSQSLIRMGRGTLQFEFEYKPEVGRLVHRM